jgi:hypothetical protein
MNIRAAAALVVESCAPIAGRIRIALGFIISPTLNYFEKKE